MVDICRPHIVQICLVSFYIVVFFVAITVICYLTPPT